MRRTKVIKAKEIVRDIRARMSDDELMIKYGVSARGLESAFKELIEANAVRREELFNRNPSRDDTVAIDNPRRLPRNYAAFPVQICDADTADPEGLVNDITEKGVQVSGIPSNVGEVKSFLVKADDYDEIGPFADGLIAGMVPSVGLPAMR